MQLPTVKKKKLRSAHRAENESMSTYREETARRNSDTGPFLLRDPGGAPPDPPWACGALAGNCARPSFVSCCFLFSFGSTSQDSIFSCRKNTTFSVAGLRDGSFFEKISENIFYDNFTRFKFQFTSIHFKQCLR